jgi:MFS family permease
MTTKIKKSQPPRRNNNNETTVKRITSRSNAVLRILAEYAGGRPFPSLDLRQTFTALKYRNYRLWFMGQLVSLVGTWMQTTAQGYLVFQLTHSPAYLGYVGFAAGVPSWLFMLYGGGVADRVPRRNLLLATKTAMMMLAFILTALTFLGLVQPWHIILLALALGVANAFDAPARQAFVFEMVEKQDLTNAIALNSSMFNLATVTGPAVAGVTYALFGPAWCFSINGLSFLAVIAALLMMQLKPFAGRPRAGAVLDDLRAGLRYVGANAPIKTLIGVAAMMSLFGMAYVTLIPAWAVTVLGGDSATNGWLLSARGLGALSGALMIAALGRITFIGTIASLLVIIFGARTHALIPLYAVGVFASFTLNQAGMVRHWLKLRSSGWRRSALINGLGATATAVVLVVVAATKFTHGAWVILLLIPLLVIGFRRIYRHYEEVSQQLSLSERWPTPVRRHTIIVPVAGLHRGVIKAVRYGQILGGDLRTATVEVDPEATAELRNRWEKTLPDVSLEVLPSPYRSVIGPLLEFIDQFVQDEGDYVTVLVPEFVPARWWHHLLHNETAWALKIALLYNRRDWRGRFRIITDVPFYLSK